ncbi:NAD-dependent epimerase/dehydratase family protein [Mucilaginibacter sp.]|jgi:dTDP-glucose 4,6-dehydratase|uniref:NAD-dependent epimerase/dehydratase family protein n=1 Tax=Mucilaginibacter sp. TaxID=1882438 RepID=UPI0035651BD3
MKKEAINDIKADCRQSLAGYTSSLECLRDQSILVTGGTGFIGKWITEVVSVLNDEEGFNIKLYLLARDMEDYRAEVPHLAALKYVTLIEQDIRNVSVLPEDVRWIIHAAGSPDNRTHVSNPLKTIETFYRGTQALLDACLRLQGLNKFVHLSSNTVYGHPLKSSEFGIKENEIGVSDCNTVNATYSEAKRMAETICAVYRNQQKLPIVITRPFSFIGPYQDLEKPWAINNFIRDSILNGPIRILGNENTVRSYMYGSDIACWLLMALAKGKTAATYNIGGDQPISLKDLTGKITSNFSNKIDVLFKYSKAYPAQSSISIPDTSAIKNDLGVKQQISFESALKRTIDWYKK